MYEALGQDLLSYLRGKYSFCLYHGKTVSDCGVVRRLAKPAESNQEADAALDCPTLAR